MRWLRGLVAASLAGLATPWLVRWLPAGGVTAWLVDLASHWQWLYLPLVALGALWLGARGHKAWLLALAALPLPWLSAAPRLAEAPPAAAEDAVHLVVANANSRNEHAEPLRRWIEQVQPDLVALVEVSPAYVANLGPMPGYPHRELQPLPFPRFGLGLLSRWPIQTVRVAPGPGGYPFLEAEVVMRGRPVHLVVFHPMPPGTPSFHAQRDTGLRQHAAQAAARGLPSLLVGDLNATPWSSAFHEVEAAAWRRAGTLAPTWPSPGRGLFGIPIDHVLASPGWRVVSHEVGPSIGSDHLPVRVQLAMPR